MNKDNPNILTKIVMHKRQEIEQNKSVLPLSTLNATIDLSVKSRDFIGALQTQINAAKPAIIAEIKRASPSQGIIRQNFDPIAIAKSYAAAGASCLSVLTDAHFFQGSNENLILAKQACNLPVLRKDFIIDPYQIYEARRIQADCILLIAAILDDVQLKEFCELANFLDMAVLVEVHDEIELSRALNNTKTPLIGINNRDLRTFAVNLATTIDLVKQIPKDRILITESGIQKKTDVQLMQQNNIQGFLVGETFMRHDDPGAKLRELFFTP